MSSVFRRRITNEVISRMVSFLDGNNRIYFYDRLPLFIKFNQPKFSPPQFEISWKDVTKLKPNLDEQLHVKSFMTCLKNQDFPTVNGIVDINLETDKCEKIVFTVQQDLFTSSVLSDICFRIETLPSYSTFFKNIPPEIVLIEYSSPNIAKPFHYGHFRSTIMGNFFANICHYVGHDVTRMNYVGDWGLQYGILAVGFEQFGSEDKFAVDPLKHLFEVYQEANAKSSKDCEFYETAKNYFKKMEEGDKEVLGTWRKLRDISLKKMEETYQRLKINFDLIHSESMYAEKSKEVINNLLEKGLAHRNDDGSIYFSGVHPQTESENVILQKSDGTSLYLSRDLAAAIDRQKNFHFDSLYYVKYSSYSIWSDIEL